MRLPGRTRAAEVEPGAVPPTGAGLEQAPGGDTAPPKVKRPLYPRLLRLRHVQPNGWQRAVLGEGALVVAIILVLADLASAWTLIVLPIAVAVVVKGHDALAGLLQQQLPETTTTPVPEGSRRRREQS